MPRDQTSRGSMVERPHARPPSAGYTSPRAAQRRPSSRRWGREGAYYSEVGGGERGLPAWAGDSHKPRQHLRYVYASLSRLAFRGLLEKGIVVFEGLTGFLAVKKPTALMRHWWNGGRGGVWTPRPRRPIREAQRPLSRATGVCHTVGRGHGSCLRGRGRPSRSP